MSYDELNEYIESMVEKEKNDYIHDLNIAYYIAVLSRVENPYNTYQKMLNAIDKKEMTNDEMENMARKLNAMFGGKVVKKGGG